MSNRQSLRQEEANLDYVRQVCIASTVDHTMMKSNLPSTAELTLAQALEKAWHAVTVQPNWKTYIDAAMVTAATNPATFAKGVANGIFGYLEDELRGYIDLVVNVGTWTGGLAFCTAGIAIGEFYPEHVDTRKECEPFRQVAAVVSQLSAEIEMLSNFSLSQLLELQLELLPSVIEVFNTVLTNLALLLSDQADDITAWLQSISTKPTELGELYGAFLAAILIEVASAGVGRAIKTARLVGSLPHAPDIQFGINVNPAYAAAPYMAVALPSKSFLATRPQLRILADLIQKVLRKSGLNFSKNLSLAKIRVIRKNMDPKQFAAYRKLRKELEGLLAKELERLRGQVERHGTNKNEASKFTRELLTFHYSEAVTTTEPIDDFNILGRKDAMLPMILESNHIMERRLFDQLKDRPGWKDAFKCLGWKNTDAMHSVLMPASQHTASVREMLKRYGMKKEKIDEITSMDTKTITEIQQKLIVFPPKTPLPGGIVIGPNTTFHEVLNTYEYIYSTYTPDLWAKSLDKTFTEWRTKCP